MATHVPLDATHVALLALQWARLAAHVLTYAAGAPAWTHVLARVEFAVAVTRDRSTVADELAAVHAARAEVQASGEKRSARLEALEAVHLACDAARLLLDGHEGDAERRAWEVPKRALLAIGRTAVAGGATPDDLAMLEELAPLVGRISVAAGRGLGAP